MTGFINSDFSLLKDYLLKNRLVTKEWLDQNLNDVKMVHKTVYSFLIWDSCIGKTRNCGKVFLHEFRSDAIQSILIVLAGYKKATALLLRRLIENILRYIYYYDHPVEFAWLDSGHYMQISDLVDYAKKHPAFSSCVEAREFLDSLWATYADISRYVHAQAAKHMELMKAMEEIKFDHNFFRYYLRKLKTIGSLTNVLLVMFNRDRFTSFDSEFKKLVTRTINKKYRHLI